MTTATKHTASAPQQSTAERLEAAQRELEAAIQARYTALAAGDTPAALAASRASMALRADVRVLTAQVEAERREAELQAEIAAATVQAAAAPVTDDELAALLGQVEAARQAEHERAAQAAEDRRQQLQFEAQAARNAAAALLNPQPTVTQLRQRFEAIKGAYNACFSEEFGLRGQLSIATQEAGSYRFALDTAEAKGDAGEIERILPRLADWIGQAQALEARIAQLREAMLRHKAAATEIGFTIPD